jgi:hypothetical protein
MPWKILKCAGHEDAGCEAGACGQEVMRVERTLQGRAGPFYPMSSDGYLPDIETGGVIQLDN